MLKATKKSSSNNIQDSKGEKVAEKGYNNLHTRILSLVLSIDDLKFRIKNLKKDCN